jgi:hypothetical protein
MNCSPPPTNGVLEMQKWVDNLRSAEDERIGLAIITVNNHYAGFGPGTAKRLHSN